MSEREEFFVDRGRNEHWFTIPYDPVPPDSEKPYDKYWAEEKAQALEIEKAPRSVKNHVQALRFLCAAIGKAIEIKDKDFRTYEWFHKVMWVLEKDPTCNALSHNVTDAEAKELICCFRAMIQALKVWIEYHYERRNLKSDRTEDGIEVDLADCIDAYAIPKAVRKDLKETFSGPKVTFECLLFRCEVIAGKKIRLYDTIAFDNISYFSYPERYSAKQWLDKVSVRLSKLLPVTLKKLETVVVEGADKADLGCAKEGRNEMPRLKIRKVTKEELAAREKRCQEALKKFDSELVALSQLPVSVFRWLETSRAFSEFLKNDFHDSGEWTESHKPILACLHILRGDVNDGAAGRVVYDSDAEKMCRALDELRLNADGRYNIQPLSEELPSAELLFKARKPDRNELRDSVPCKATQFMFSGCRMSIADAMKESFEDYADKPMTVQQRKRFEELERASTDADVCRIVEGRGGYEWFFEERDNCVGEKIVLADELLDFVKRLDLEYETKKITRNLLPYTRFSFDDLVDLLSSPLFYESETERTRILWQIQVIYYKAVSKGARLARDLHSDTYSDWRNLVLALDRGLHGDNTPLSLDESTDLLRTHERLHELLSVDLDVCEDKEPELLKEGGAQRVIQGEGRTEDLVALRKEMQRDKKEVISEIRKATMGTDKGCHHRDATKDKIVQKVICHLAKPGVTFSIHDACKKIGEKGTASWLYSWCHDHEEEVRAQVDILRSTDKAFRS